MFKQHGLNTQRDRQQHLFVVRIWQESNTEQPPVWRGLVEHIPFGQRMYFTSLNDLSDFIALHLEKSPESKQDEEEP